ncbi:MAG: hypothetical protein JWM82_1712, partial [Myxococcales bacterium]|nr:hypothetical protein [Myxococcales bacterium]
MSAMGGKKAKAKGAMRKRPERSPQSSSSPTASPKTSESAAPPFLVAGVGASAGGLEAFTRVLEPIDANAPLALILVQHLARDHRSLLPDLLARSTRLVVEEGRDGLKLHPGRVYVIRPDTRMAVIDGCLRVTARPPERAFDSSVDHLFASLAEQYREKAIGVVLSGSGHDGSSGIRAIREAGGITVAQEPSEAQTDSMPRSAIATGAVELTLPAA